MTIPKCRKVRAWLKKHPEFHVTPEVHCGCDVWTPFDMSVYFFGRCEDCAEDLYDHRKDT